MKFFRFPLILSAIVLAALAFYTGNPAYIYQALVLSVVEVSLSFDNAVVNASKLNTMSKFWREAFLIVGLPIAVFGMRFVLPLVIVDFVADTGFVAAWDMAFNDHEQFSTILTSAHTSIAGFGGAFLLMTAFEFFLDEEKETHWLGKIESILALPTLSHIWVHTLATAGLSLLVYAFSGDYPFIVSAGVGIATFIAVHYLKVALEYIDARLAKTADVVVKGGLGTFIYLEILDASFSLDGVIAAFAISKDVLVVAAGLGIGALFVRSMTIKLVEAGTLSAYKYLENGAFWSIFFLGAFMYVSVFVHIPEYVIAGVSVAFIGWSLINSLSAKKAEAQASA